MTSSTGLLAAGAAPVLLAASDRGDGLAVVVALLLVVGVGLAVVRVVLALSRDGSDRPSD